MFKIGNMKVVIAISGPHGVGKSTVAKRIAELFNLRYISAGQIFREKCKASKLTLEEFSKLAETSIEIDQSIENKTFKEALKGNVVIDAQLAGWITRNIQSIKIYLTAPIEVRVRRIADRDHKPYDEVLMETLSREESEKKRFKAFYNYDLNDLTIYDMVLNTANLSVNGVIKIIEMYIREIYGI